MRSASMRRKIKKAFLLIIAVYFVSLFSKYVKLSSIKRHHEDEVIHEIFCNHLRYEIRGRVCLRRYKWLTDSDEKNMDKYSCFQTHYQLNSTSDVCDVIKYLVIVEGVCEHPPMAEHFFSLPGKFPNGELTAVITTDLSGIYAKLDECGHVCEFMAKRIRSLEEDLISEILKSQDMTSPADDITTSLPRLKILVHMGLLTRQMGLNFGEAALKGGPLGELVQWSDLLATLHLIGHDVILSWSPERLDDVISTRKFTGCQPMRKFDLIFTDVTGMEQMKGIVGNIQNYRCVLRILDVYGTEAEFNHPMFNPNKNKQNWGGKGLHLSQFFTHFPHSPDNSFLGFVIPHHNTSETTNVKNKDRALIYGKLPEVIKGNKKRLYLDLIHKYFTDIHATIYLKHETDDDVILPPYVTNHGNMEQKKFVDLLETSSLFIGLESPLEGPAVLEAISRGAIFLNPKFAPPKKLDHSKPTRRKIKSQNPFAQDVIGEPHVYTVNIRDLEEVENSLRKIKSNPPIKSSQVPPQFTVQSFIKRMKSYIEHQDFCKEKIKHLAESGTYWFEENRKIWPSPFLLKNISSSESCSSACSRVEMICETSFFPLLNDPDAFPHTCRQHDVINPPQYMMMSSLVPSYFPAYHVTGHKCFTQSDPLLFSCSAAPPPDFLRLCPCRPPLF